MSQLQQTTDLEWIMQERLQTSLSKIADFCQRWHIIEFALFGSVLRDDFRPDSDIDILVVYQPDFKQTFEDKIQAQTELEALFNREVDITRKHGLVNPFSRREILQQHRIIHPPEKAQLITLKISNKTMQDNVRNSAAIWDMLQVIQEIQAFIETVDYEAYLENLLIRRAVERNLEILGEAARRTTEEFRNTHPEIDWRGVIGLRNIVAHQYDRINQAEIWQIITINMPDLQGKLQVILPPISDIDE